MTNEGRNGKKFGDKNEGDYDYSIFYASLFLLSVSVVFAWQQHTDVVQDTKIVTNYEFILEMRIGGLYHDGPSKMQ